MRKYVKIILRDKGIKPIYLPIEKWESIVNDPKGLVAYKLEDEPEWTGRVLNKADVVFSEFDKEYSLKTGETKYTLYRNTETNTIIKVLENQLPPEGQIYEKL